MTAIFKLRAESEKETRHLSAILLEMIKECPNMDQYAHPGIHMNQLSNSQYDHGQRTTLEDYTCCNATKIIQGPKRSDLNP